MADVSDMGALAPVRVRGKGRGQGPARQGEKLRASILWIAQSGAKGGGAGGATPRVLGEGLRGPEKWGSPPAKRGNKARPWGGSLRK